MRWMILPFCELAKRENSGIMTTKVNEAYFPTDLCLVDFEACGNTTSENLWDLCSFARWVLIQTMSSKVTGKTHGKGNRHTDTGQPCQPIGIQLKSTLRSMTPSAMGLKNILGAGYEKRWPPALLACLLLGYLSCDLKSLPECPGLW